MSVFGAILAVAGCSMTVLCVRASNRMADRKSFGFFKAVACLIGAFLGAMVAVIGAVIMLVGRI